MLNGRPATQPRRRGRKILAALHSEQLSARPGVVPAYAASVSALVTVLTTMVAQTEVLAEQVEAGFGQHPDAEIYRSQPGLGTSSAPGCWPSSATTHTATPTPGPARTTPACPRSPAPPAPKVVLARYARNRRLADALYQQAFSALTGSPGARAYYDGHRARGATHHQALRALANRLVGILHGCLATTPSTTKPPPGATGTSRRLTP